MGLQIRRGPIKVIPREPQSVFFRDPWVGWIGGLKGNLLKSVDGGYTWHIQNSPISGPINDVYFVNADVGFVAGWQPGTDSILCRTRDGGESWVTSLTSRTQPIQPGPDSDFPEGLRVQIKEQALEKAAGVLFGKYPVGGFAKLSFADDSVGMALAHGSVLITKDGGLTWEAREIAASKLEDGHLVNAKAGWVVSERGQIFCTRNGGRTWELQREEEGHLYGVHMLNSEQGFAVGDKGLVLRTTNGGRQWKKLKVSGTNEYTSFRGATFINARVGFVYGHGLYLTQDGGDNWQDLPVEHMMIYDLFRIPHPSGYAVDLLWGLHCEGDLLTLVHNAWSPADARPEMPEKVMGQVSAAGWSGWGWLTFDDDGIHRDNNRPPLEQTKHEWSVTWSQVVECRFLDCRKHEILEAVGYGMSSVPWFELRYRPISQPERVERTSFAFREYCDFVAADAACRVFMREEKSATKAV